jgi:hypothetical protein
VEEKRASFWWAVRVPPFVHQEVDRLARIERRKRADMLRIILEDGLAQHGVPVTDNSEAMKKADAT